MRAFFHADLNADPGFAQGRIPTTENLVRACWDLLAPKLGAADWTQVSQDVNSPGFQRERGTGRYAPYNLMADPHVELQDGQVKQDMVAREVTGDERAEWWETTCAMRKEA